MILVFAALDYPHARPGQHSNFLLGAEIGYARQKEKFTTRFSSPLTIPPTLLDEHSETISDKGTLLGIIAGWQYRCHRVLLGIEGAVDFQNYTMPRGFMFSYPKRQSLFW